ncbi:preprotein translocase subunit SecG [Afipia sp. P52-10]|jgi:preprotein translocase subunit SecG|uniref:preprotein translocase subunit SecG n=1 Tax=Afipia sp. P52-10 TaxID=1429916 RepID=UPI0003DF3C05|nr:preprotein translocase subunit SecG [Afipia sp. P52-10]ETR75281.1 preprotein translocase subunit SecG [Afipia sp. P52-10]
MHTVIIVIHLMIVAALIGVVLLQRSEGGGLGMGSGGGGGFMTGRGTANLLTRTTAFLAIGFFLTSLLLSWLAGLDRRPTSILDTTTPAAPTSQPGSPAPPLSGGGGSGGVLDTLRQQEQKQAPATPSGPQVPRSQ